MVIAATSGVTYAIATTTGGAWGASSCDDNTGATTTSALLSLGGLVTAGYVGEIPLDPTITGVDRTGYYLYTDDTGVLKVGSCVTYEASTAANAVIEIIR